jgi:protein phosphatase
MEYKYSSLTNIGLKRTGNEDFLGVFEIDNGILAIVCDGLGGNKAGEIASQLGVNSVYELFKSSSQNDYLEKIKSSILGANKILIEKSSSNNDLKGMATTIEVLFLKDNTAFWGHVGDSRIYHLRNGKLKQLTKDHSLVQKLVDEGYLTLKEAEHHPNKNIIMRALGDNSAVEIDLSKIKLNPADNSIFFLCTDGVTGVIQDSELEPILSDYESINNRLTILIEKRGAPDNFSFVVIAKK